MFEEYHSEVCDRTVHSNIVTSGIKNLGKQRAFFFRPHKRLAKLFCGQIKTVSLLSGFQKVCVGASTYFQRNSLT